MNRKEHLRISREVLGLEGNPEIHKFLDSLSFPNHRITHNISFVERNIEPYWGRTGRIEAYAHILADWGFFDGILKTYCKKRNVKNQQRK